jgi:hypothetical protein
MGEWRYSSTILDLGAWAWLVIGFTLLSLYSPGKEPPTYPLDRLAEPWSQFGRCGEENISWSYWESNPGRPQWPISQQKFKFPIEKSSEETDEDKNSQPLPSSKESIDSDRLDGPSSIPGSERFFSSPRPDRLCGPPNLLSSDLSLGVAARAKSWPLTFMLCRGQA